jgi:hypothetical protein
MADVGMQRILERSFRDRWDECKYDRSLGHVLRCQRLLIHSRLKLRITAPGSTGSRCRASFMYSTTCFGKDKLETFIWFVVLRRDEPDQGRGKNEQSGRLLRKCLDFVIAGPWIGKLNVASLFGDRG